MREDLRELKHQEVKAVALEEQIVAWARQRPSWQREIMSKIAKGEILSDSDYEDSSMILWHLSQSPEFEFGLKPPPRSS